MRYAPIIVAILCACSSGSNSVAPPPPPPAPPPPPPSNPVPSVTSAVPGTVLAGGPAFTLTVTGTNFIASSVVRWNGQARPTTYVSATEETAQIPTTDIAAAGSAQLTVFTPSPGGGTSSAIGDVIVSPVGVVIYDSTNNVTWLADANLASTNRFGFPVCTSATDPKACVNTSGSMSYQAVSAWVQAMNAAVYLGHTNWQLPTTPDSDATCPFVGPHNESFGFTCMASALGSLYYTTLGLKAPNTAVPIPNNNASPFSNFQPYLYWSQTIPADTTGHASFSFNSGFQGSNTEPNYLYVIPAILGKIPGTPAAVGTGLQINPGGQSVYDPVTNVTWAANANLGATNTFGLPPCTKQGTPSLCVNQDGAMNWNSASQFVLNMNTYLGTGYLGQTNWVLPPVSLACDVAYLCAVAASTNPFGNLYYSQLGFSPGTPVVGTPASLVGGFRNIQPYLYWGCEGATVQSPCQPNGPVSGFEWSFSFGNGFQGTDVLKNNFFAFVYFVGRPN